MSSFPTLLFQVAFADTPYATAPTWTDLSSRLRAATINRGRRGELDTFREGTASFRLDNRDRALEPEYTGSAYSPNVVPNKRCRLSANGTVVFDGFIDSIRPGYVRGPAAAGDAFVDVDCTDLTKFIARARLVSPYARAVRDDAPTHWWRCGDPAGSTVMYDDGATRLDGEWTDRAQLGAPAMSFGSSVTSVVIAGSDTLPQPGRIPAHAMPTGSVWTWEALVERPATIPGTYEVFHAEGPAGTSGVTPTFSVELRTDITGDTGVYLHPRVFMYDGGLPFINSQYSLEGRANPVHLVFTRDGGTLKFYANGTLIANKTGWGTSVNGWIEVHLGVTGVAAFGTEVRVGEIAIYDGTALSAATVAVHAAAAQAPWLDDSTGDRVGRILDLANVPAAFRDIATGATIGLGKIVDPIDGESALQHLRTVEVTEQGRLFISKAGAVTFLDRHHTVNVASVATFGDSGSEVRYADLVEDFSEQTVVNEVTVTRQGGLPQTATDGTTEGALGYVRDGVLYASDVESFDAANWFLGQYSAPLLRFDSIVLHGSRASDVIAQCIDREIADKVTVKRRPPGGGAAQSKDVIIEGIQHVIEPRTKSFTTTFSLSPAGTRSYWQLGTAGYSELGSTTRLAF